MPKPCGFSTEKNLVGSTLKNLRKRNHISQQMLAKKLQLLGLDIDKNVITRIETNKRSVTDLELRAFAAVLQVSYKCLIDGEDDD